MRLQLVSNHGEGENNETRLFYIAGKPATERMHLTFNCDGPFGN